MDLTERTIDSREVFRGRIIRVRQDTVRLPNGKESSREVVEHPGGVGILAIDGEDRVVLVRQYRYALSQELLELPAGKIDLGEDHRTAAVRELEEETGLCAQELLYLGEFYPSVGYLTEVIHLYIATGLTQAKQHLDPDEFLNLTKLPLQEAVELVLSGQLPDGKSQALLLRGSAMLQAGKIHLQ